jgi:hypothetical protein
LRSKETRELLELERQFWDAMKRKDGSAAERLTAEECIVVGRQGVSAVNRAMMSNLTAEGQWTLRDFRLDEGSLQVKMLADEVASVAYKVTERLLVEGQELSLEANDASVGCENGCEKTASGSVRFIRKRWPGTRMAGTGRHD